MKSGFFCQLGIFTIGIAGRTDLAAVSLAATSSTKLSAVVDDLQVQTIPTVFGEGFF